MVDAVFREPFRLERAFFLLQPKAASKQVQFAVLGSGLLPEGLAGDVARAAGLKPPPFTNVQKARYPLLAPEIVHSVCRHVAWRINRIDVADDRCNHRQDTDFAAGDGKIDLGEAIERECR